MSMELMEEVSAQENFTSTKISQNIPTAYKWLSWLQWTFYVRIISEDEQGHA